MIKIGDKLQCWDNHNKSCLTIGKIYTATSDSFVSSDHKSVCLIIADNNKQEECRVNRFVKIETKENKVDELKSIIDKYKGSVKTIIILIILDEVLLKGLLRKKLTTAFANVIKDLKLDELMKEKV